jgi:hypothetical protein
LYGCTSGEAGAFVLASKARRAHLPIPHRCQYLYLCTSETRAFVLVKHAQYRCQYLYGCTSGEAGTFVLASKTRRAHLPIPHRCQYLYFCTSETRAFGASKAHRDRGRECELNDVQRQHSCSYVGDCAHHIPVVNSSSSVIYRTYLQ